MLNGLFAGFVELPGSTGGVFASRIPAETLPLVVSGVPAVVVSLKLMTMPTLDRLSTVRPLGEPGVRKERCSMTSPLPLLSGLNCEVAIAPRSWVHVGPEPPRGFATGLANTAL